jgi:two-component system, chemotaxis family, protein-glutamate methylesterase/glutaminase
MRKLRVAVIDDSALMRELLGQILGHDPEIEVVATAPDPVVGWEKIKATHPDVVTLDVEMPKMDGLKFLDMLMTHYPLPVVMVSSLTESGCETTLRALELGAIDFVTKPKIDMQTGTVALGDELCAKVKAAGKARLQPRRPVAAVTARPPPARGGEALIKSTHKVLAIGASTGGTEALRAVLTALPSDAPGVVVVQHMPEKFTRSFAERLDGLCKVRVKEAEDNDRVLPGHVLIAPGNYHLEVRRSGANYLARVFQASPVSGHRPSVDVLFDSCSRVLGANAVGVILTGMGADGARGMLAMHRAGARTIAQDEATCVVFGMPREAIACGGVDEVLPLGRIAAAALKAAEAEGRAP